MAILGPLTDARIYVAGADLSGYSNQVEVAAEAEALDKTTFTSSGYREFVGGHRSLTGSVSGFFDAGSASLPDDRFFADLGATGVPWSVCPTAGAVGDVAYTSSVFRPSYTLLGDVGQLAPFTSTVAGDGKPLVRGQILHPAGTARTTTGTGTSAQLGTVSATQRLYAALHVFSVSGTSTPTLTVKVQSDNATGFPSSADVITFTGATAVGGQFSSAAGAITDDWFRVSWTISGTTPSFTFAVVVGIATP